MELVWAQSDSNSFAGNLAGPLITGARWPQGGTIQHRDLADVPGAGQSRGKALVLTLQGIGWGKFLIHAVILSWRSHLSFLPCALAWPLSASASKLCVNTVSATWNCSWVPSYPRVCSPKPMRAPTAATASTACGAPSLASFIKSSNPTAPAARLFAKFKPSSLSTTRAGSMKAPALTVRLASDCPSTPYADRKSV